MFEEFEAKYDDFCWYEITDEQSKTNLEEQAKREIGSSSPLYAIKDRLKAVAKSERQDDVLFFEVGDLGGDFLFGRAELFGEVRGGRFRVFDECVQDELAVFEFHEGVLQI